MLNILLFILSSLGICWIILGVMLLSFGGSVKVSIINPITKKIDILTDINILKNRNGV